MQMFRCQTRASIVFLFSFDVVHLGTLFSSQTDRKQIEVRLSGVLHSSISDWYYIQI